LEPNRLAKQKLSIYLFADNLKQFR